MRLGLVLWGVGGLLFSCSDDPMDRGEVHRGGSGAIGQAPIDRGEVQRGGTGAMGQVVSGGAPSGGHREQAGGGDRAVTGGASLSAGGSSGSIGGAADHDVAGEGGALPRWAIVQRLQAPEMAVTAAPLGHWAATVKSDFRRWLQRCVRRRVRRLRRRGHGCLRGVRRRQHHSWRWLQLRMHRRIKLGVRIWFMP